MRLNLWLRWCGLIVLLGIIAYYLLQVLIHLQTLMTILIGAVLFAYLVHPVVMKLRERMPLGAAVAFVYLCIIVVIAGVAVIVVPAIANDAQHLAHDLPRFTAEAQRALTDPNDPITARLPEQARGYLMQLPAMLQDNLGAVLNASVSHAFPILFSIVSLAALFIIVPVVSAYLMVEANGIRQGFIAMFPVRLRPRTASMLTDIDRVIGGFIRGQLIVAAVVGTLITILLLILHVPYAALIGVFAGILDVVPYVGAIAGWLPAFFIALFVNGWEGALFVTLGIVAINQLEGHVLAPVIVSKSVELPPIAVLLALLAGGELAGIPGLLLAVPVAGIIRVVVLNLQAAPHTFEEPLSP